MKRIKKLLASACVMALYAPSAAFASGGTGSLPWETPLNTIMESVSGPVARTIGIMAIVVTGLGLAFGEGGGGMRKMLWVVFGLSITFAATSLVSSLLNFSGGVSF